jgi:hypothetical protein
MGLDRSSVNWKKTAAPAIDSLKFDQATPFQAIFRELAKYVQIRFS